MKSVKCPNCGANLQISDDRPSFFCEYCGAKILNDSGKYVYERVTRIIDEARLKEAENEMEKVKLQNARDDRDARVGWAILLGIFLFCVALVAFVR